MPTGGVGSVCQTSHGVVGLFKPSRLSAVIMCCLLVRSPLRAVECLKTQYQSKLKNIQTTGVETALDNMSEKYTQLFHLAVNIFMKNVCVRLCIKNMWFQHSETQRCVCQKPLTLIIFI